MILHIRPVGEDSHRADLRIAEVDKGLVHDSLRQNAAAGHIPAAVEDRRSYAEEARCSLGCTESVKVEDNRPEGLN